MTTDRFTKEHLDSVRRALLTTGEYHQESSLQVHKLTPTEIVLNVEPAKMDLGDVLGYFPVILEVFPKEDRYYFGRKKFWRLGVDHQIRIGRNQFRDPHPHCPHPWDIMCEYTNKVHIKDELDLWIVSYDPADFLRAMKQATLMCGRFHDTPRYIIPRRYECGICGIFARDVRQCNSCRKTVCTDCRKGNSSCIHCAVKCEMCGRYTSKEDILECGDCGAHVCALCANTCRRCGKIACTGCMSEIYCSDCGQHCPCCGIFCSADDMVVCESCGESVCSDCTYKCENCGVLCVAHQHRCGGCREYICECEIDSSCRSCNTQLCKNCSDITCSVCEQVICGLCTITANCGHYTCKEHVIKCERCGQTNCSNCTTTTECCGQSVCLTCAEDVTECPECGASRCKLCSSACETCGATGCVTCNAINECSSCKKKTCSACKCVCREETDAEKLLADLGIGDDGLPGDPGDNETPGEEEDDDIPF